MAERSRLARLTSLVVLGLGGGMAAVAAEPSADWLGKVSGAIAEQEYEITWQPQTHLRDFDAAWHAPNRAHGLRTFFTEAGPRVVPRTDSGPSWEWGLTLVGYGRSGLRRPVAPASLRPTRNRIEYARGAVTEWYENSARGLEQGFTLWEQIEGTGPVHLDMRLEGTLEPVFATDGQAVDFRTGKGVNVLHYAQLVVTDADGRRLPASIEGFSGEGFRGLRIVFEDEGAVYPVTVDPLATSPAWGAESDQADAWFGQAVATAGDVNGDGYADVIVGAPQYDNGQVNEGRAYVYHGSAAGLSIALAWMKESDKQGAGFGGAVATAGDVNGDGFSDVIIGARSYSNDQSFEGRAFVYHGSAAGLQAVAAWTDEGDEFGAGFGAAVATAGDVNGDGYSDVIVGAPTLDDGEVNEGWAFVYLGSPAGVLPDPAWAQEGNQAEARYGEAVATAGDVNGDGYADVVVGAPLYDGPFADQGAAFAYHGSASGLVPAVAWMAVGHGEGGFGVVSTAGDVNGDGYSDVIVGEPDGVGAVWAYYGSAAGLQAISGFMQFGAILDGRLGTSVSTAGDINGDGYADVIVGSPGADSAFAYLGSASGLSTLFSWWVTGQELSAFGTSVGTAGDVNGDGYSDVIVGAPRYDKGQMDEGLAFVYHGSAGGLAPFLGWSTESDQASAQYGLSVSTAGDVNGDGYSDVIVGAPRFDSGQADEGRAFVYLGSSAGPGTTAAWTAESNKVAAFFGQSVSAAGDVNGDGYSDVIVGAYDFDIGPTSEGRVFVYHGSPFGLSSTAAWTADGDQAATFFGNPVSAAGDVNGDGYGDVLVGARYYDHGHTDEGRAFVYLGSVTGLRVTPVWTAESDQASAFFGHTVATAGDVNGDGYSDVLVGAPGFDNVAKNSGRVYVYYGSAAGPSAAPVWVRQGDQLDGALGASVASAGDVNGDGYADVILGAEGYDNGQTDEGRAYVYQGSASGLSGVAAWTMEIDQAGAQLGASVATAGDVNGDGYADVILGVPQYDHSQTDEGGAFVYYGSAAGLSTTAAWAEESDQDNAWFGVSAATAGDVNGDGYADVLVGAHRYDDGEVDEGGVFLYYGNGVSGRGLSLSPRQRRASDTAPVDHLGVSDNWSRFRIKALSRTPFGRGRAKLEWEVKPLGTLFNGAATSVSTTWINAVPGALFNQQATGLSPFTVYHWRVRLRYHPATTPFQQRSRWFTVPLNGWQEADLRTASAFAATIGPTLSVAKTVGGALTLSWTASCLDTDFDYAIYEGKIGTFYSHAVKACSTNGGVAATITPGPENHYFLVVPQNGQREGSYGLGPNQERPAAADACFMQDVGGCQ